MVPVLDMFTSLILAVREKRVRICLRIRQLTFLFLLLTSFAVGLLMVPRVMAAMKISELTPTSGQVGTQVQLIGNVTNLGDPYEIRFDEVVLLSGNASGSIVDVPFIVPQAVAGNHTARLVDLTSLENATATFTVVPAYNMTVQVPQAPGELQEGDSVLVSLNITGAEAGKTYLANFTVQMPSLASHVKLLSVTSSSVGTAVGDVRYPDDFSSGANTNLVGDYSVLLNETLGAGSFIVGLTNSTEYHRGEPVDIKAVYKQDENVTLTIAGTGLHDSLNLTADTSGVVHYAGFSIPSNASIGSYMVSIVSISSQPTTKSPPDTQYFTVPGFAVNVTAINLAGESVPSVEIRAFENSTSVENATTVSNGLAVLTLEVGTFTLEAYFKGEKVGEISLNVVNTTSVDIVCSLTDLEIRVVAIVNGVEFGIPQAGLLLKPDNVSLTTDINGTAVGQSLLPNVTYSLNASRYGVSFNFTTVPTLLVDGTAVARFNVTIFCPTLDLQVNVLKADGQPFGGAVVKIEESLGGLNGEGSVGADGIVRFNVVFGMYDVEVYDINAVRLNGTTVSVFTNQNVTVYCILHGLSVSVTVVDYVGQPFSNVNVTLQGEGLPAVSQLTQGNGTATFNDVDGGSYQVAVYLPNRDQPTAAEEVAVSGSTAVQISISKYVLLAGVLVETSQLAVVIIVVVTVVLIVLLEVYLRRRSKPEKTEASTSDKDS